MGRCDLQCDPEAGVVGGGLASAPSLGFEYLRLDFTSRDGRDSILRIQQILGCDTGICDIHINAGSAPIPDVVESLAFRRGGG